MLFFGAPQAVIQADKKPEAWSKLINVASTFASTPQ
jgi:hypothetical protein